MLRSLFVISAVLAFSASEAHAISAAARAVAQACKPDIRAFCSTVAPGEGRIKACMKAHLPELSEPCKEALFQVWLSR